MFNAVHKSTEGLTGVGWVKHNALIFCKHYNVLSCCLIGLVVSLAGVGQIIRAVGNLYIFFANLNAHIVVPAYFVGVFYNIFFLYTFFRRGNRHGDNIKRRIEIFGA